MSRVTIFQQNNDIFIFGSQENLGYARGNNIGKEFLKKHFKCDYYFLVRLQIIYFYCYLVSFLSEFFVIRPVIFSEPESTANR